MKKTTIHIPDDLSTRIDEALGRLKMSRDRFFLEAARAHLRTLDRELIPTRINQFIAEHGQDTPDPVIRGHVRRQMLQSHW
jgi:hypothetical protein